MKWKLGALTVVGIITSLIITSPAKEISTGTTATTSSTEVVLDDLAIESLRQKTYGEGNLQIEQTLEPGGSYNQYIVSYLSDGLKIYALLTLPKAEPPPGGWPAIVFNHGNIPPDIYKTTQRYVQYVDALASADYVVLKPDYRGHGNSEGVAYNAYSVPDYTIDILNAVAALRLHPQVDPDRIGMWGHSTGGHLALRAMVIDPTIKAAVIWGGVVGSFQDLLTYWPPEAEAGYPDHQDSTDRSLPAWRRELLEAYGDPDSNPEAWQAINSTSYLGDLSGPIQFHHALTDEWVPAVLSERTHQQIINAGKISELHLYENDDHNLINNFGLAMTRTIAFYDQYLQAQQD
jgi:uncharacterized protein